MFKSFCPSFFKKAVGSRGKAPGAVRRLRKTYASKSAGGAKNSPVDCFSVGNPRRGFTIILFLLCILPSETYFFYTLKSYCKEYGFNYLSYLKAYFEIIVLAAKYTKTSRPKAILYQPKTLKSCFLIYDIRNLITKTETKNATAIPTNR